MGRELDGIATGVSMADPCLLLIAGTRPEVIKMAPVYREAKRRFPESRLLFTGQHGDMALKAMSALNVVPDDRLDVLRVGDTLVQLSARLMAAFDDYLNALSPDFVLVQGDTTSAAIGGLAAFYRRYPVAHVEAGLRSHDNAHPFPEEVNRKIIGDFAALHFPPTARAASNLIKAGVDPRNILISGNTVVDAVECIHARLMPSHHRFRRLLVTMHRRESWDGAIEEMCRALKTLVERNSDIEVLLPMHQNPVVRDQITRHLQGRERMVLSEPLGYLELQQALLDSFLVLTDSGGIQEEAPCYGVPVLVMRRVTERPEAVEQGLARVVGTDEQTIVDTCQQLLDDPQEYRLMATGKNPFGDGKASVRIVDAIGCRLLGKSSLLGEYGEFQG